MLPRCHFPKAAVAYPAAESVSAMLTSHCVSPSSPPPIGTEWVPERMEKRPVMKAERLGVHCASTLKLVSRVPSAASRSMRGVGAPRVMPAAVGAHLAVT